jgi:hypothetical protein
MLEFLGNLFIGKPLNVLAVAAVFVAVYLVRNKLVRQDRGRPRWLLVAALCWCAYAAWEWLVVTRTPDANIRVDLLLIYPVLAAVSGWAIVRIFK